MEASKRQTKKVAKAEHPKKTTLERTLSRASYYINGGEISKGYRALDGNQKATASKEADEKMRGLHPQDHPRRRK